MWEEFEIDCSKCGKRYNYSQNGCPHCQTKDVENGAVDLSLVTTEALMVEIRRRSDFGIIAIVIDKHERARQLQASWCGDRFLLIGWLQTLIMDIWEEAK